jgi:hypothetical protein
MDLHMVHKRKPVWIEKGCPDPLKNPVRIESWSTALPNELQILSISTSPIYTHFCQTLFLTVHTQTEPTSTFHTMRTTSASGRAVMVSENRSTAYTLPFGRRLFVSHHII